ncbi:MAG: hypothetical protein V4563_05365 [Pseudomonadota bacterium]
MKSHNSNSSESRSLPEQIRELEQNIVMRRYLIDRNLMVLRRDARKHLATPQALFTSAGLGMAIGIILRRRFNTTKSQSGSDKLTQIFTNLFKIAAIARTLAATLPSRPDMTEPESL